MYLFLFLFRRHPLLSDRLVRGSLVPFDVASVRPIRAFFVTAPDVSRKATFLPLSPSGELILSAARSWISLLSILGYFFEEDSSSSSIPNNLRKTIPHPLEASFGKRTGVPQQNFFHFSFRYSPSPAVFHLLVPFLPPLDSPRLAFSKVIPVFSGTSLF